MLLSVFRSKSAFIYIVLLLFALIVFYGFSFQIIDYSQQTGNLFGALILEWFNFSNSSYDYISIGFGLVFIQAIVVSALSARFSLFPEVNILPSFIYLLLIVQQPELLLRPDVAIAFLFISFAYFYLFNFYRSDRILYDTFKLGLFLGFAFLFLLDILLIAFLVPIFIGVIRGQISLRDLGTYFIGLILPFYFYLVIYFLVHDEVYAVFNQLGGYFTQIWPIRFHIDNHIVLLSFLLVLLLFSSYKYFKIIRLKLVIRRYFQMLSLSFYLYILAYFVIPFTSEVIWAYLLLPLSLLFSLMFSEVKRRWFAELLFVVFFTLEIMQLFGWLDELFVF
ncbi:MAG: hypothetical protein KAI79_17085 [Bacteroidales bacterium]|nr:hypothetical protein [Bacteroidales bacterium]